MKTNGRTFNWLAVAGIMLCGAGTAGARPDLGRMESAIIGGDACAGETFPATVALMVEIRTDRNGEKGLIRSVNCTGTLIAPDVVLTAAHCLDLSGVLEQFGDMRFERMDHFVSLTADLTELGNPELTEAMPVAPEYEHFLPPLPADAIRAVDAVVHPSFVYLEGQDVPTELDNMYDVGLLFLESPVTSVQPALLVTPEEANRLEEGAQVSIVGWGLQVERDAFEMPAKGSFGRKICGTSSIHQLGTHEMQIGGAGGEANKCHGDSGGPVFFQTAPGGGDQTRLIGIASRTYGAYTCADGSIETRVDAWLDWIDQEMIEGCRGGHRTWCDIEGIILPDQADSAGGCAHLPSSTGQSTPFFWLLVLAAACWRKRLV